MGTTKSSCHNYLPAPNLNVSPIATSRVCAICVLKSHIEDIKAVQYALESRGGIFVSKTAGQMIENGWMYADHRICTMKWRIAKIECYRTVEALEKLCDEYPEMIEGWGIDEALYLWELAADECSKVPGYKYVGDTLEEDIALGDAKKLEPTASIPIVIPVPKETIPPEDDSGWAIVTHIWKKRSQPWSLVLEDEEEKSGTENTVQDELEAIDESLDGLLSFSNNLSEALAEAFGDDSDHEDGEPHSTVTKASETSSTISTSSFAPGHGHLTRNMLQSVSKRISHPGPRSCKSVTINPEATLIPSEGDQIGTQPHNDHAAAEKRRRRVTWNRRSRSYSPSTWASPDGFEKYDTSYFRVSWTTLEPLMNNVQNTTEDDENENSALNKEAIELGELERGIEEGREVYIPQGESFPRSDRVPLALLQVWQSRRENRQKLKKRIQEEDER